MNKFDAVFEEALFLLREEKTKSYITSTFKNNIGLLIKTLASNDLIKVRSPKEIESLVNSTYGQPNNVKEVFLTPSDPSIPPVKIEISQEDADSESFLMSVVDVSDPTNRRVFPNTHFETAFKDVLDYIMFTAREEQSPEAKVKKLPVDAESSSSERPDESALPT